MERKRLWHQKARKLASTVYLQTAREQVPSEQVHSALGFLTCVQAKATRTASIAVEVSGSATVLSEVNT